VGLDLRWIAVNAISISNRNTAFVREWKKRNRIPMKTKTSPWSSKTFLLTNAAAIFAAAFFLIAGSAEAASKPAQIQAPAVQSVQAQPATRVEKPTLPANQRAATLQAEERDAAPETNAVAAPDAATTSAYTFATTTTGSLTDMSAGTTQLVAANQDDTASTLTNIGFDFYLLGTRYTQFGVSSNGYMRVGGLVSTANYVLGTASQTLIAAMGSDEITSSTGKVHYKVTGVAPNRVLNVEWKNQTIIYDGIGTLTDGTFQVHLYETTGVVDFVYGSMNRNTSTGFSAANNPQYIGFSIGSAANSFISVDTANNASTAVLAANQFPLGAPMASLTSVADGSRRVYTFTPATPTAPTGLSFTAVTPVAMTLNWTDSPDEELYAIYNSTDGTNFSFVNTAAQNSTSFIATGLNPSTTYFWRVFAVSQGAFSTTALTGSQATTAPGNITSNGTGGGNWSVGATWSGGIVPTATDNVTILSGDTVIDDASAAFSLTVQSGAILQFDTLVSKTLTVATSVTINSGGIFRTGATGLIQHVLSVGGDLTNNGTLDFSTNGNQAGAGITFTGAANNTFGGTGATTNIRTMTINKGTSNANILELNPTNFTVQGAVTDSATANYLTLTNGTLKISGTFTAAFRTFSAASYSIGATQGFWLNNPNYTVSAQTGGSATVTGLFRASQGTFNVGTATGSGAANSLGFVTGSTIIVEGTAVINAASRFGQSATGSVITYTQTGTPTITVCTAGNTSTTLGSFDLGTAAGSTITMTGGTIIHQLAASTIDYRFDAGGGPAGMTGGTLQMGNASSGAAKSFNIRGVFPNLVMNNVSAGHSATMSTTLVNYNHVALSVTINSGNTFNIGNAIFLLLGDTVNNGTLTAVGTSSRYYHLGNGVAQNYSGTGVTTAMNSFDIDNPLGLTISSTNQVITTRVILFTGSVTGSGKITLGNGAATTGTIQIGNTTTPTIAGTFDAPLTFNLGTGGEVISYLRTGGSRTTGGEVTPTRSLTTFTYDDNDVTHNLTIAGGNLTVTSATALTNGRVITGANTLISGSAGTVTRTTGYVDGNFRKTFTAAVSKTFEVGTANGYSPVAVNATAGTPADFTAKAVQGQQPNISGTNALQRYWTLTATGLTANLTFNYLAGDVVGTEANYKIFKYDGSFTQFTPNSLDTTNHIATLNGVSSFSDWTLAEPVAVQSGNLQFSAVNYNDSETNADHTATITVARTGGTDGAVSVHYATSDGTATTADNDYVATSGDLNWAAGDATNKTFTVTVKGDTTFEADETVNLTLTLPTGGSSLGSPNPATLTILNDDPNTPPSIAAVGVTRQKGTAVSNSTIATVNDTESGPGAVVVTVTSANPSNGVTISNIVNSAGTVTADVVASCSATSANFTLQASDGNSTATDTLTVTVTANPAPTLTYSNASVPVNGSTTVNPATGPTDNGNVSTIVVLSPGTYTGTISVDNGTGFVSISNAAPIGSHTITIEATDNCGTATDATFTLTVDAPACVAPSTVYVNANWVGTTPGNDPDGAGGPATSFGCDSFATIQDGVNGVTNPGTVIVYAGTYPENVLVNKALTILGAKAGQNADTRFAAFVTGPNGPKADPTVESILTAAVNDPFDDTTGVMLAVLSDNVTIDGLVVDGNNPALGASARVINGVNIHQDFGITNFNSDFSVVPNLNNLQAKNNIVQNINSEPISMFNDGTVSSGLLFDGNVIRNFRSQGIILFNNAFADVTNNTVDVNGVRTGPGDPAIGMQVQNFSANGTMTWSGNKIKVGQDNFGIHINLFSGPTAVLNISGNTVNAATGVTGTDDFTWGINVWSVSNGATVQLTNNTVGSAGGVFGRGINLWNLPTSNTVGVTGGSVGKSATGINLDNVDPFFGGGADTTVNINGVSISNGDSGIRVRATDLPPAPNTVTGSVSGSDSGIRGRATALPIAPRSGANTVTGVSTVTGSVTANMSGSTVAEADTAVRVDATSSGANTVTMRVTNSTLSGNTAASGGALHSVGTGGIASTTITNSTLSENSPTGTSIFLQDASLTVGNSIFNAGDSGTNISANGTSTVASLGYNLSSDNFGGFLTNTGDQVNTDPMLGPLKNNGGPTLTHAPLNGSTAIDKGKDIGPISPTYTATGEDQRGSTRPITYDASIVPPAGGDRSDIGSVELAPGVKPQSAASWLMHGPAGFFPINLPLTGPVGIECRTGAVSGDYQIIVTFAQPITFSSAAVTSGTGSVSSTSISRPASLLGLPSGTQVTIDLAGVTNLQTIVVALFDVNDGANSGDDGIRMGMLLGDVTGNGSVTGSDVNLCKAQVGAALLPTNFRNDVNATGSITGSDVNVVKAHVGDVLP
jgi:hypothetical protein